jgi:hypothetical protein
MSVLKSPVRGADDVVALLRALVPDGDAEGMLVVGLDHEQRLCGVGIDHRHRALSFVKVWELDALAAELDARSVVVAVFPRAGGAVPTEHELRAFADLRERARRAQVSLVDCLVVRGHRWWSLRELSEGVGRGSPA